MKSTQHERAADFVLSCKVLRVCLPPPLTRLVRRYQPRHKCRYFVENKGILVNELESWVRHRPLLHLPHHPRYRVTPASLHALFLRGRLIPASYPNVEGVFSTSNDTGSIAMGIMDDGSLRTLLQRQLEVIWLANYFHFSYVSWAITWK